MTTISQFEGWVLIDSITGWPVEKDLVRKAGDSENAFVIRGGRPPERANSTGRVWVTLPPRLVPEGMPNEGTVGLAEYFPSVFGLEWTHTGEIGRIVSDKQLSSAYTLAGVHRMKELGGGFASALAEAYFRADKANRIKLMQAFYGLFETHARHAEQMKEITQ